jgi:hypothetical protein
MPPGGEVHLGVEALGAAGHQLGVVAEQRHGVGGPQDQVGDVLARTHDLGELLGAFPLVAKLAQVPMRLAQPLGDLPEGEQAGVGVR